MISFKTKIKILGIWDVCFIVGLFILVNHVPLKVVKSDGGNNSGSVTMTTGVMKQTDKQTGDNDATNELTDKLKRSLPCYNDKCDPEAHTKVALVTYMRSGSTLTGDILSKHPDVFYVFEPLHYLAQRHNQLFDFLHDRKLFLVGKSQVMKMYMSSVFHCNFEKLDVGTLTQYHMKTSKKTLHYFDCLKVNPGIFGLVKCLPSLHNSCMKAKVILAKTISLPMRVAVNLIKQDPKLKVVHLVRDPRATIWSHGKFGAYKGKQFHSYVKRFCDRLTDDLMAITYMKHHNPNRTRVVVYENLARFPLRVSEALYSFIGLPMTHAVTAHVRNITMQGHEEIGPMAVSKANSTITSNRWRLNMPYEKALFIDRSCSKAYQILGYKPLRQKTDLSDLALSLHSTPEI